MDKIDKAISIAAAETGVRGDKGKIPLCFAPNKESKRIWTKDEETFLQENYSRIPEEQIAKQLGRSLIGTHLHREREMHLVSMTKHPSIISAEQVANGLGVDGKTIHLLMDTGRMPCRRLPSVRIMRFINRVVLLKWMIDPENWLYFKPQRVGTFFRGGKRGLGEIYDYAFWKNARVIILKNRHKWEDQWLTPGQVMRLLRIEASGTRYINKAIHRGTIKAKRWGNWWIRKSDLPHKGKTINFRGEILEYKQCPH